MAKLRSIGSALTVLLLARYVNLGQLGPIPDLYDPTWFTEKLLAAFAEGAATAAALAGVFITGRALMDGRPRRGSKVGARQSELEEYRDQEEHRNEPRIHPRRAAP